MATKRSNTPKIKIAGTTKVTGAGQKGKTYKHRKVLAAMKEQEKEYAYSYNKN